MNPFETQPAADQPNVAPEQPSGASLLPAPAQPAPGPSYVPAFGPVPELPPLPVVQSPDGRVRITDAAVVVLGREFLLRELERADVAHVRWILWFLLGGLGLAFVMIAFLQNELRTGPAMLGMVATAVLLAYGHRGTNRLRLHRLGRPWWAGANQMLQFLAAQLVLAALVVAWAGPSGLLAWLGAAAVGYVLFQLVNYVEHYGLLRRQTAPGTYERVQPHHSWNSEHAMGRILLYELTRHSDHHYLASRPYHTLRYQPAAPAMPTGYPGMMLLATLPPLWFRVMNKRVPAA